MDTPGTSIFRARKAARIRRLFSYLIQANWLDNSRQIVPSQLYFSAFCRSNNTRSPLIRTHPELTSVWPVQPWLGHESLATTQKYLEPSKETEKQLAKMRMPF